MEWLHFSSLRNRPGRELLEDRTQILSISEPPSSTASGGREGFDRNWLLHTDVRVCGIHWGEGRGFSGYCVTLLQSRSRRTLVTRAC